LQVLSCTSIACVNRSMRSNRSVRAWSQSRGCCGPASRYPWRNS
jgi:hypothetical protein